MNPKAGALAAGVMLPPNPGSDNRSPRKSPVRHFNRHDVIRSDLCFSFTDVLPRRYASTRVSTRHSGVQSRRYGCGPTSIAIP